jgi:outer membrane protein
MLMRRCGRLAYLLVLVAGVAASEEAFRIAVIDPNRIVEESPQYEAARNLLSAEAQDRETELSSQQEDIDRLEARLERDGALMRADEVTRLRNDIRARERRLRYAREELQADFALRQSDLRTKLVQQVEEVVEQVAKENDIDLILSEGVVYSSDRVNISDEVIDRLKQVFDKR